MGLTAIPQNPFLGKAIGKNDIFKGFDLALIELIVGQK
jgi:hypothetical protein